VALLLLGGKKTGDVRWYRRHIPIADRIFDEHLIAVTGEGKEE